MGNDFANLAGVGAIMSGFESLMDGYGTNATYAVGTPVDYGAFLEEGTSRMPPYPWLGPATTNMRNRSQSILQQADDGEEFVRLCAAEAAREATDTLESGSERPFRQSGNLAGSVTVVQIE